MRTAPTTGSRIPRRAAPIAPPSSPRDTRGFANPAVVTVEVPRAATVPPWTAPAIPPPTTRAITQFTTPGKSPITAAEARVPATTATGVARVSRIVSTQGTA